MKYKIYEVSITSEDLQATEYNKADAIATAKSIYNFLTPFDKKRIDVEIRFNEKLAVNGLYSYDILEWR